MKQLLIIYAASALLAQAEALAATARNNDFQARVRDADTWLAFPDNGESGATLVILPTSEAFNGLEVTYSLAEAKVRRLDLDSLEALRMLDPAAAEEREAAERDTAEREAAQREAEERERTEREGAELEASERAEAERLAAEEAQARAKAEEEAQAAAALAAGQADAKPSEPALEQPADGAHDAPSEHAAPPSTKTRKAGK